MTGGGAYLVELGGSIYYLLAGLGLLGTAWLLFRRRPLAVWLYAALFL
jgi:quinoprotein glucose dehydrogenase